MITLKCQHCDASLERVPGVGLVDAKSGDLGGTYDYCPENPVGTEDVRKHAAVKLRQVQFTGWVSVDDDAWKLAYGTDTDEIAADVRTTVAKLLRSLVTDELMVRDTMVRVRDAGRGNPYRRPWFERRLGSDRRRRDPAGRPDRPCHGANS